MKPLNVVRELGHLASVVRGNVPAQVVCDRGCRARAQVTYREAKILAEHRFLLCPCGGHEWPQGLPHQRRRRVV